MWVRLNQDQMNSFLDEQIVNFEKNSIYKIKTGFIAGLVVMIPIGFFVSFIIKLLLNIDMTIISCLLSILICLLIFEIIDISPYIKEYFVLKNLDHINKRTYLKNKLDKNLRRFCPECGEFYSNTEKMCVKCGGFLRLSNEYIWIE